MRIFKISWDYSIWKADIGGIQSANKKYLEESSGRHYQESP